MTAARRRSAGTSAYLVLGAAHDEKLQVALQLSHQPSDLVARRHCAVRAAAAPDRRLELAHERCHRRLVPHKARELGGRQAVGALARRVHERAEQREEETVAQRHELQQVGDQRALGVLLDRLLRPHELAQHLDAERQHVLLHLARHIARHDAGRRPRRHGVEAHAVQEHERVKVDRLHRIECRGVARERWRQDLRQRSAEVHGAEDAAHVVHELEVQRVRPWARRCATAALDAGARKRRAHEEADQVRDVEALAPLEEDVEQEALGAKVHARALAAARERTQQLHRVPREVVHERHELHLVLGPQRVELRQRLRRLCVAVAQRHRSGGGGCKVVKVDEVRHDALHRLARRPLARELLEHRDHRQEAPAPELHVRDLEVAEQAAEARHPLHDELPLGPRCQARQLLQHERRADAEPRGEQQRHHFEQRAHDRVRATQRAQLVGRFVLSERGHDEREDAALELGRLERGRQLQEHARELGERDVDPVPRREVRVAAVDNVVRREERERAQQHDGHALDDVLHVLDVLLAERLDVPLEALDPEVEQRRQQRPRFLLPEAHAAQLRRLAARADHGRRVQQHRAGAGDGRAPRRWQRVAAGACVARARERKVDRRQQPVQHLERREAQRERAGLRRRAFLRRAAALATCAIPAAACRAARRRRALLERQHVVAVGDLDALRLCGRDEVAEVLDEAPELLEPGVDTDELRRDVKQRADRAQRVLAHADLEVREPAAKVHGHELGEGLERLAGRKRRHEHLPGGHSSVAHHGFLVRERG
ncbi:hypothetical protein PybrP1_006892 [[Pythium] brassicae (nom. inval.)]|nr:hypothetical protein PybrP1_006892 [[Pythium] brassicae (nom. inval.)]